MARGKYFRVGTIVSGRLAWKPTEGDPGDDERRGLKTIICPTTRLISVSRVPARHATRNESPTPLKLRYNRAKTISSWDVIALRKSVSRVLNIWPSHWSNAIKKTHSIDLSKESAIRLENFFSLNIIYQRIFPRIKMKLRLSSRYL